MKKLFLILFLLCFAVKAEDNGVVIYWEYPMSDILGVTFYVYEKPTLAQPNWNLYASVVEQTNVFGLVNNDTTHFFICIASNMWGVSTSNIAFTPVAVRDINTLKIRKQ